jgi:hypothetical protein
MHTPRKQHTVYKGGEGGGGAQTELRRSPFKATAKNAEMLDLSSMSCIFCAPDELDAALHEDVVEAEDEPHQHEHLDHLDRGRHLQTVRYAQEPEKFSAK